VDIERKPVVSLAGAFPVRGRKESPPRWNRYTEVDSGVVFDPGRRRFEPSD